MNLKQIQAVELLLSKLNHNKRLVVVYDNHLVSADFLSYKLDDKKIKALADENINSIMLENYKSYQYFANKILYRNVVPNAGHPFMTLGNKRYDLSNNIEISPTILKEIIKFVERTSNENGNLNFKEANITPHNVEFIGTDKTLPFYLFPEGSEFTPVSLVDRELTFD